MRCRPSELKSPWVANDLQLSLYLCAERTTVRCLVFCQLGLLAGQIGLEQPLHEGTLPILLGTRD